MGLELDKGSGSPYHLVRKELIGKECVVATATITSKGQLTLPKEVRDRLGLHPGDKLEFLFSPDGRLVVMPRTIHVEKLFGLLHREGEKAASLDDIEAGIAAGAVKGER